jgi:YD repeat-containing protein
MTSVSTQSLTYDAEGRLLTLTDGSSVTDSFTYDGDGRRVTKTSPAVAGTTYVTRDRLGSTRLTSAGAWFCFEPAEAKGGAWGLIGSEERT